VSALWALQVVSYKVRDFPLRATLRSVAMMVVSAVVMAEAVWLVARLVGSNAGGGAVWRVIVGTVVGVTVYGVALRALGASEVDQLLARFRRVPTPPAQG
jgi:hypothetical protein